MTGGRLMGQTLANWGLLIVTLGLAPQNARTANSRSPTSLGYLPTLQDFFRIPNVMQDVLGKDTVSFKKMHRNLQQRVQFRLPPIHHL